MPLQALPAAPAATRAARGARWRAPVPTPAAQQRPALRAEIHPREAGAGGDGLDMGG